MVEAPDAASFLDAIEIVRSAGHPWVMLGAGTNVVASDDGFSGIVVRYRASTIESGGRSLRVDAGTELQSLVDFAIAGGLEGLHTMTGIPGWVGAAIYGNAGAYGHSISEFIREVRFHDGERIRTLDNAGCGFDYRESVFKHRKDWTILSAELDLPAGDPERLAAEARRIREIRDAKYPPAMRCAGSIFKNLLAANVPAAVLEQVPSKVVIEGKVPSAWFLEQVGGKGMRRGDIQVASYHANLIYNDGRGAASGVRAIVEELKRRVQERFHLDLEEEVQYVGF